MANNNNNNNQEPKYLEFKGKKYVAVPEDVVHGCKGCALIDKGCYNSVRAQAICRQGYIFKRKEN